MKNQMKRFAAALLSGALLFGGFGSSLCHAGALDQLRKSAEGFGEGKTDTDYFVPGEDAGSVLSSQIEAYTAGREDPQPMDEEQVQSIVDDADDDEIVNPGGVMTIGSEADIQRALQTMVDDSKTVCSFELSGGYTVTIDTVFKALTEVERADPVDSICVAAYGCSDNGQSGYLTLDYDVPLNQLRSMKQETRTLVSQAVSDLSYLKGESEIKIIYDVNEYVCDKVVYPPEDFSKYPGQGYSAESHTAWSALKYGSAVCDGYARTTKLILNEFGIKCDIVYGNVGLDPNAGHHAWNLVNVENAWYHMDVCWNDGSYTRQDYFLIPDSALSGERLWGMGSTWPLSYPSTAATPYDYKGKI